MANANQSDKDVIKIVAALAFTPQDPTAPPTLGTNSNPGMFHDTTNDVFKTINVAGTTQTFQGSSAHQALSGAGAVNVTARTTLYTSTGASQALTLADGKYAGQRKTIMHAVDGGSGILTPTHLAVYTTVTFTNVRDWVELEFDGTNWNVVAIGGAVAA